MPMATAPISKNSPVDIPAGRRSRRGATWQGPSADNGIHRPHQTPRAARGSRGDRPSRPGVSGTQSTARDERAVSKRAECLPVLSRQGLGEVALRVLLRLGRQDEAIAMLTKSRTAKPDDEDIVVGLADPAGAEGTVWRGGDSPR